MTRAQSHDHDRGAHAGASPQADPTIDPVCGMTVDPRETPHHLEHRTRTVSFCSAGCRDKFIANPERYLATAAPAATEGTIYTCPMHPQIR